MLHKSIKRNKPRVPNVSKPLSQLRTMLHKSIIIDRKEAFSKNKEIKLLYLAFIRTFLLTFRLILSNYFI